MENTALTLCVFKLFLWRRNMPAATAPNPKAPYASKDGRGVQAGEPVGKIGFRSMQADPARA